MKKELALIQKEFKKLGGILLLSDETFPSLVSLIAGEPVKGSWWGHPQGNLMFNVSQNFEDEDGVLVVKLVNKKVTYLHRDHWSALFTLATYQPESRTKGLKKAHLDLLKLVQKRNSVRVDDPSLKMKPAEAGKLTNKLEEKMLVYSQSIHTDSGKHVRVLKTWNQLMKDLKYKPTKMSVTEAREHFEKVFQTWSPKTAKLVKLPF